MLLSKEYGDLLDITNKLFTKSTQIYHLQAVIGVFKVQAGCDNFLFSRLPGRASLAIKLLAQTCPNNKTVCVKLKSQNMSTICN